MAPTRRTAFLTDDLVRSIQPPTDKMQEIVWDAPDPAIVGTAGVYVPGLGLRCTAGGVKAFVLNYLAQGVQRRPKLGRWPAYTVDKARRKAIKWRGEIEDGRDPQGEKLTKRAKVAAERERERAELTVRQLAERFDRDYIATKVRPRTAEGYRSQLRCHVLSSKIATFRPRTERCRDLQRRANVQLNGKALGPDLRCSRNSTIGGCPLQ